jgi:hypothetical protein
MIYLLSWLKLVLCLFEFPPELNKCELYLLFHAFPYAVSEFIVVFEMGHVSACVGMHARAYMCACVYACMYVYACVRVCVCLHVCMRVCV